MRALQTLFLIGLWVWLLGYSIFGIAVRVTAIMLESIWNTWRQR